jgi:hypothetical protein
VTSAIEWTGESEMWADEALAKVAKNRRAPKLNEAKQFLTNLLANGPKRKKDIEDAAEKQDFEMPTVERAKSDLGYLSKKDGFRAGWKWYTQAQWKNYQKVLKSSKNKVVKFPKKQVESETDDHLRFVAKNEKNSEDPQAQKFDHLGAKRVVKKDLKPAGSKGSTEGDQGTEESTQNDQVNNSEKTPEDAKAIKSPLLGKTEKKRTDSDGWGAIE